MSAPLLQAAALEVRYSARGSGGWRGTRTFSALHGIDLEVAAGEALGIVGESGSGKSTLARALLALTPLHAGRVVFDGRDLAGLRGAPLRAARRGMQMIFQDPLASLDPRMSIERCVTEPLVAFEAELPAQERRRRALPLLERVGLDAAHLDRYPHQLSGGQAQRAGIARALIAQPRLLVCDEPVASLDGITRSQVLALLQDLRRERDLALVFIAHDLGAVSSLCERVLVLYLGRVMESGASAAVLAQPRHPYTRALLASVPVPDPARARARRNAGAPVRGEPASPLDPPSGCVFRTRCPYAIERCVREVPPLRPVGGVNVACHRAEEISSTI